jgi:hypothetical protein
VSFLSDLSSAYYKDTHCHVIFPVRGYPEIARRPSRPPRGTVAGTPICGEGFVLRASLAHFRNIVTNNGHSDMTQGPQTAPSELAKPEPEPASTADKTSSEPAVASAGGALSISIVIYTCWGGLSLTPYSLNRTREAA